MARAFLYFIAFCIVAVIASAITFQMFRDEITAIALVPSTDFAEQDPLEINAYASPALWYAHPEMGTDNPARWRPAIRGEAAPASDQPGRSTAPFAVFFVHPTSYFDRSGWNAPAGDAEAERIARLYVRGLASPFNAAREIWAPRYRQATIGAFLTDAPEAQMALDVAYRDVAQAYSHFRKRLAADTAIVLVGHSQGALHLLRLLREEVATNGEAEQIAAVYAIGWPISIERDLPALPLPACTRARQSECILAWSSFAEPADPSSFLKRYSDSLGWDGEKRGQSAILCTNPLTGMTGGAAGMEQNLGTLVPQDDLASGELVPGAVPARCDARGLLLIGDPPKLGNYVLPGNNYHIYDIPLFWANTRADVTRRVEAWAAQR